MMFLYRPKRCAFDAPSISTKSAIPVKIWQRQRDREVIDGEGEGTSPKSGTRIEYGRSRACEWPGGCNAINSGYVPDEHVNQDSLARTAIDS